MTKERAGIMDRGGSEGRRAGRERDARQHVRTTAAGKGGGSAQAQRHRAGQDWV